MRRIIDKEIEAFIESISDMWKDEPLDGGEIVEIAERVFHELNEKNGNI